MTDQAPAPAPLPLPVRAIVTETWIDRVADWPAAVWERWGVELDGFTEAELLRAVRIFARRGSAFPPSWGEVYAIATPMRTHRLERAALASYQGNPS